MDKRAIIGKIVAVLTTELEGYSRSARSAHAEATDEQSKAENKYDTRGLEAAYLAKGQSRQAAEVMQAIQQFQALSVRQFADGEPIDVGALVEVTSTSGERATYFIGPRAGGVEIECEGRTILVITPHSPVGQQIAGRKTGDTLKLKVSGSNATHHISAVL